MITVYRWRVLEKDQRGRDRWRTLGWHMREDEAAAWALNNARQIVKVAGSEEIRRPLELRASGGIMCSPGFGAV